MICDQADLRATFRLTLAEDASALVREEVQLGRHGQLGGRYRGGLAVDHAGTPLLRHTTVLDGADPGLTGPAGIGGHRVVATLLGVGDVPPPVNVPATGERSGLRWARHDMAGPGWLLLAVGGCASTLRGLLDDACPERTRCDAASAAHTSPTVEW